MLFRSNYNSTILGDVGPYAYGEPKRLADQTAFMAVPHKIPKIVPELRLPEAQNTDNTFLLSHGVDDGDVAAEGSDGDGGPARELERGPPLKLHAHVPPLAQ